MILKKRRRGGEGLPRRFPAHIAVTHVGRGQTTDKTAAPDMSMNALDVYNGSDGELTKRYYAALESRGPSGMIAMNLFRAQKCSARAKVYRGGGRGRGSYRSMGLLCEILAKHGVELGIRYGWKQDPQTVFGMATAWVLYVDLPTARSVFIRRREAPARTIPATGISNIKARSGLWISVTPSWAFTRLN